MSTSFSKLLVAHHSPKNKCYVEEGTTLIVRPLRNVPTRDHVAHYFVSAKDGKTRSRYGWVKETETFSLDGFICEHWIGDQPSNDELKHLEIMLKSVSKLTSGTPCAATYSRRGIEVRTMEFTVHRVLFYEA